MQDENLFTFDIWVDVEDCPQREEAIFYAFLIWFTRGSKDNEDWGKEEREYVINVIKYNRDLMISIARQHIDEIRADFSFRKNDVFSLHPIPVWVVPKGLAWEALTNMRVIR